jgi:hypothetical protein
MLKSPYKFIISPLNGEQYVNEKDGLIVNTSIEEACDVQRVGVVKSVPVGYEGDIKTGDKVVVQHNIFRVTFDDQGIPRQSDSHIKDDLFGIPKDLIYLIIRDEEIIAPDDVLFVEPIIEHDEWHGYKALENIGIAKYVNADMQSQGISSGDKIAFKSFSNYEFELFGTKYWMMKSRRITAKLS